MYRSAVLLVAFACLLAVAVATPAEWDVVGPAEPSAQVNFTISLRQRNLAQLDLEYEKRTDPNSPLYGQWLTIDQIMDIVAPSPANQQRVVEWLRNGNCVAQSFGDFVSASGKVSDVEALLKTKLYNWVNVKGRTIVRHSAEQTPKAPAHLADIIELFSGLDSFPVKKTPMIRDIDPTTRDFVVPQTLRQAYQVPESLRATNKNSSQAIVEFGPSSGISFEDLRTFEEGTNTPLQNISHIVGDFQPFSPANGLDGEATLDAQYIIAMGMGVDTSYWNVNGWIIDLTNLIQQRLSQGQHVPWIFSMSYGWAESQQCVIAGQGSVCTLTNASQEYVARTNVELQKVGLTGITMVGLSQDAGAASKWNMMCNHPNSPVNPSYPGSSPYLVCLGATMLVGVSPLSQDVPPFCKTRTCAGAGEEVVCSTQTGALITSGGGFSNDAPRPSYQDAAVKAWLASDSLRPPRSDWNAAGRGYPDISTLGHQYAIVMSGNWGAVDGTSASAPAFAGLVGLMNDARFNAGKGPLGPLNPALYDMYAKYGYNSNNGCFHDITVGNNTGTEVSAFHPHGATCLGYGATKGWDPATGLGVPNFAGMMHYVMNDIQ
mmetsp:Transcript_2143/g.5035  ORF Transcript_2143/g.5035 Transcript_2143/m.5035 type:complete len:601 (-) Transcript_2143:91-1893(-)|eukprot:CAMPEP_0174237382 /NCGR_PEP_ID=MMETSP0417-20130205/8083_1 /TAXON_ID=242541 /ORGANISM="Mayorella sp, Strain BSH-02190019" /LENGTH=600 /DNA_ID=CAMNT_0015316129 /DNA_START=13 /DNA_END=1815 /DNA_ORIENTATION=+